MADQRWLRLKALHERVFELPLAAAREIVEREFADDAELAKELISLLEQKTEDTSFLQFDDGPSNPSIFPPHHRLGDYELLHEIGRGGMGFVYLARHLPLQREVALKVLNPSFSIRPEHVERFRREAQRLAQFTHPGIVPIFDVQSIGSVHFFAMEYVDGLDLHRELVCLRKQVDGDSHRATLPAPESKGYFRTIADLLRQAASALADAHDHKITHRDIKPHNLILGRDGRLRIVDFGIARDESMGRVKERDEASGTIYYMSPEQARLSRDRVVDHRTDIYSLGVVLYELLTLRRPFDGATQMDILKAIEVREPKPIRSLNPRVPRDLAVICHKAMEKEPSRRYTTARELASDLERFLSSEAIHATPPTWSDRAWRFGRRHRLGLGGGAVAAAAVLAGFFLRDAIYADPSVTLVRFAYDGPAGAQAPRRLSIQEFDPLTERLGESVELGTALPGGFELPTGFVRVRVDYDGGQFSERMHYLSPGVASPDVSLPPRFDQTVPGTRMQLIEGGMLRRRVNPRGTACSNLGQDIPIEAFWIDEHEVTLGDYRAYLQASGHPPPEDWRLLPEDPQYDRRPVVLVNFEDMQAFAAFHGKRLPTHAEWEWAARGAADRRTPNGANFTQDSRVAIHGVSPTGSMLNAQIVGLWMAHTRDVMSEADDVTPQGVWDLLGNVREVVESPFVDTTPATGPVVHPDMSWVLGGAWYDVADPVLLDGHSFNSSHVPGAHAENGFRCARSVAR